MKELSAGGISKTFKLKILSLFMQRTLCKGGVLVVKKFPCGGFRLISFLLRLQHLTGNIPS